MAFNFFQKFSQKKGVPKLPIRKNEEGEHRTTKQDQTEYQVPSLAKKIVSDARSTGNNVLAAAFVIDSHVSEKATALEHASFSHTGPSYIFRAVPFATKLLLKKAIENRYNVKVSKVRIINTPSRTVRRGKILGHVPGYKKAIVTLAKDQSIDSL